MNVIVQQQQSPSMATKSLLAIELLVALAAIPCGILLVVNGLGMSSDVLRHSPFESFVIPGLLLSFAVGGSALVSALLLFRHESTAPVGALVAGCISLGWIVVEAIMVPDGRVLQAIVFAVASLAIVLSWRICHSMPISPKSDRR
jgi:hypothetical protein